MKILSALSTLLKMGWDWFINNPSLNVPFILGAAFYSANKIIDTFVKKFVDFIGNQMGEYSSVSSHLVSMFQDSDEVSPLLSNILYAFSFDEFLQVFINVAYFTIGYFIEFIIGIGILLLSIFGMMAISYAEQWMRKRWGWLLDESGLEFPKYPDPGDK